MYSRNIEGEKTTYLRNVMLSAVDRRFIDLLVCQTKTIYLLQCILKMNENQTRAASAACWQHAAHKKKILRKLAHNAQFEVNEV